VKSLVGFRLWLALWLSTALVTWGSEEQTTGLVTPKFELQFDLEDEVSIVYRPRSVGTNIHHAKFEKKRVGARTIEKMIGPPIIDALSACRALKNKGTVLRVRVMEGEMKDSIGESSSRLSGIGLYINAPDASIVELGTSNVAAFAALVIELKDGNGSVLATREFSAYERESPTVIMDAAVPFDRVGSLKEMLERLVRSELATLMPSLVAGACEVS
jgi:hypothetical protein